MNTSRGHGEHEARQRHLGRARRAGGGVPPKVQEPGGQEEGRDVTRDKLCAAWWVSGPCSGRWVEHPAGRRNVENLGRWHGDMEASLGKE